MTFSESKYYTLVNDIKIFNFGTFYLCKGFVVAEVNEGCNINSEYLATFRAIKAEHYGENSSVSIISNRIHDHSVDPLIWMNVIKEDLITNVTSYVIVAYSKNGILAGKIENSIIENMIPSLVCESLNEALNFVESQNYLPKSS